jgi:hypothetical protein
MMDLKDILTVAASIIVGLGSAWLTAYSANARAAAVRKRERERALREYERVLADIFHEWSDDYARRTNTPGPPYAERMEPARAAAWPYLHDFPEDIRPKVTFPLAIEAREVEGIDRLGAAVQGLSDYLDGGRPEP